MENGERRMEGAVANTTHHRGKFYVRILYIFNTSRAGCRLSVVGLLRNDVWSIRGTLCGAKIFNPLIFPTSHILCLSPPDAQVTNPSYPCVRFSRISFPSSSPPIHPTISINIHPQFHFFLFFVPISHSLSPSSLYSLFTYFIYIHNNIYRARAYRLYARTFSIGWFPPPINNFHLIEFYFKHGDKII